MDRFSEQIRFICKYKLETIKDIENLKEQKQEELQKNLNTRNRLYYKRKKLTNESEKNVVTKEIISVTSYLDKVRKEIKLCDEISTKSLEIKEKIKEFNKNNEERKKKVKTKERDKKYYR